MTLMYVVLASVTWNEIWVRNVCWWMILNSNSPQHRRTLSATPMSWYHHRLDNVSLRIPTGPFCTISQFWLFTGQCISIADQWKLLYIFWKQSGDLRGWRVWLVRIKLHTNVMVRVRFRVCWVTVLHIAQVVMCRTVLHITSALQIFWTYKCFYQILCNFYFSCHSKTAYEMLELLCDLLVWCLVAGSWSKVEKFDRSKQ